MKKNDFIIGFSEKEKERISIHIKRLLPYCQPDRVVFVGGLAIRYHVVSHGISYPSRPFNDIDVIVRDEHVVSPAVSKDFLVYHYHPSSTEYFLALVDPISQTKIDIFSYDPAPQKTIRAYTNNQSVLLPSIEDQLVKTVFDMQRISEAKKVDPKQFMDARLLMTIAYRQEAERLWRLHHFPRLPATLSAAIERAETIAKKHPEWLQEKPFRKLHPFICPHCQSKDGLVIAPMEKIYKVLGYSE